MPKVPKEGGVKLRGTTGLIDNVTAGIPLDGGVTFGTDTRYQGGKETVAIVELVNPEDGSAIENGTLLLSVGKGWDDANKGRSMVRADGSEPGGINDQTMYQTVINNAMDSGAEEIITERFEAGVMPFHSELLEGLIFRWERKPYTPMGWKDEEHQGEDKPTRLLPVEYLGEMGSANSGKKKDKKKKAATDE